MIEYETPGGGPSSVDLSLLDSSMRSLTVDQVELREVDVPEELTDAGVLDKLIDTHHHVFVLSETGRPIFMSGGLEDELCGLFAIIGVFVSRIEHWDDSLQSISSGGVHVHFSHRKPLILCIVSRQEHLLQEQLSSIFDQIVSTLSRSQLETIYQKRGDNYDLRKLLKGTDRYMESCLKWWHSDVALLQSSIRILPMNPTDREFLSNVMLAQLSSAKLEGLMFGLVLAHRQIVSVVRYKKYTIDPRDIHVLINLVGGNPAMQLPESQTWTPICLPKFNDSGFFYAYISYPWENVNVCFVLLSVKRDHFDSINKIKITIVEKLEANTKFFVSFQETLQSPLPFEISKIGNNHRQLWHFVYKNRGTRQICVSSAKVPIISAEERRNCLLLVKQVAHVLKKERQLRCLFLKRQTDNILIWITEKFHLHCIFSPFTSPPMATAIVDRLLKTLKTHELRYFILSTPSY